MFEGLRDVFGEWIGKILIGVYRGYFVWVCIVVLWIFTRIVGIWVVAVRGRWVMNVLVIRWIVYIGKEEIRGIVRFKFILRGVVIVLCLVMLYGLKGRNMDYLMGFFETEICEFEVGVKEVVV